MKRTLKHLYLILLPSAVIIAALLFFSAISNLDKGRSLEDKKQLEETVLRAVVSCYSVEGAYPPSFEYLAEHYNIRYNDKKYTVKYEFCASNLMPDITVLEN